jgi:hypothetical protein
MARALTRTPFHSSRLLRTLSDLAALEAAAPGTAFAERLGLWVDYTDAITLCAVHSGNQASPPAAPPASTPDAHALAWDLEFARLRAVLERAITSASLPQLERTAAPDAAAEALTARDITAAYEPYRRYYLAQQRDMELKVPPLRSRVREVLAQGNPALQQLAALDAALDGILGERETRLLAALPQLLKKRFAHQLRNHAPEPFGHELQTVLLAELDLRLQPALGLIEALHQETTKTP